MKKKHRSYAFALGIALALVILLAGVIIQSGYVLSGSYLVKGGTLTIEQARPHSDVFVDNRRKGRIGASGIGTFAGIKPGERDVIVAHAESWPWVFDFEAKPGANTTLRPLQTPESPIVTPLLSTTDPVRQRADAEFAKYREPTSFAPLERNGVRVWLDSNTIVVHNGDSVRTIFSSPTTIRTLHWYGDRNDAIIVGAQNSVFALDIRESQLQNFHPIFTGNTPESVVDPIRSSKIFVRDADGNTFALDI